MAPTASLRIPSFPAPKIKKGTTATTTKPMPPRNNNDKSISQKRFRDGISGEPNVASSSKKHNNSRLDFAAAAADDQVTTISSKQPSTSPSNGLVLSTMTTSSGSSNVNKAASTKVVTEEQREIIRLRRQRQRRNKAARKRELAQQQHQPQVIQGSIAAAEETVATIVSSDKEESGEIVVPVGQSIPTFASEKDRSKNFLNWPSEARLIPVQEEQRMVDVLMERHDKKERGMLRKKPPYVLQRYLSTMNRQAPTMTVDQLCSLRRHHVKLRNPILRMSQLRLGKEDDINESARLFEKAVQGYLEQEKIRFQTENEYRSELLQNSLPLQGTPDFVFLDHPVTLRKIQNGRLTKECTIHWLEVKMFYGASTIPHGTQNAVGAVLAKAQKYHDLFGPGAMLFMMGCGERLAQDLNNIGVVVLDCAGASSPVDLQKVRAHQRKWCATPQGEILP